MNKIHFDQIGGREVPQMCQRSGMLMEDMDQGSIFQGTVSPGSNVHLSWGEVQWPGQRWESHLPPHLQDARQLVSFKVEAMDQYRVRSDWVLVFGMKDNFWETGNVIQVVPALKYTSDVIGGREVNIGEYWYPRCAGDLECCLYAVQYVENWRRFQSWT